VSQGTIEKIERHALVVDDETWVRSFIREVLEVEGFDVLEAANGETAAKLLHETPSLSLIVTDILMPQRDGVELIREIKSHASGRQSRPKILAISGGGIFAKPEPFLSIAHSLGADMTLAKPFSDSNLREALRLLGFSPGRAVIGG